VGTTSARCSDVVWPSVSTGAQRLGSQGQQPEGSANAREPTNCAAQSCAYAIVATDAKLTPNEVERCGVPSIQITVLWGTNALRVFHLTPPRDFYVGEANGRGDHVDALLPSKTLGAERWQLLRCRDDAVTVLVPPRAHGTLQLSDEPVPSRLVAACSDQKTREIGLVRGSGVRLTLEGFTLLVAHVDAARSTPRSWTERLDRSLAFSWGLSGLAAAVLLGAMAWTEPGSGLADNTLRKDQLRRVQQYLGAAAERELEQLPPNEVPGDPTEPPEHTIGPLGERAKGEEGRLGSSVSRATHRHVAVQEQSGEPDQHLARAAALREAREFGLIGLLSAGAQGDPSAPVAPWGQTTTRGSDEISARGNLWGDTLGEAFGGGLGLSGIGEGGGGDGEGIGLGPIGHGTGCSCGYGYDDGQGWGGRLGGSHRTDAPRLRTQPPSVSGQLPPELVARVIRQGHRQFQSCYTQGLDRNPTLAGQLSVRFVIGRRGEVSHATNGGSDLADAAVVRCVVDAFYELSFPEPKDGIVSVQFPMRFSPS